MKYYRGKYIIETIHDKNKLEDYLNDKFRCGYEVIQITKEDDGYMVVFERYAKD